MTNAAITPADSKSAASGLLIMSAAMLIVPVIDAIAKHLSVSISPLQISWSRFALTMLVLCPFVVMRGGLRALLPPHLVLHFFRGFGIAGATAFFFGAVAVMPLADVAAIFFVEPLILTIFSAIFLGEGIGWRRILAVVVGFAGAMLIIRPSFSEVGIVALMPLGAAFCFAGYMVITKKLAGSCDPWTMQAMAGISGTLLLGALMLAGDGAGWLEIVTPSAVEMGWLCVIAAVAMLCHSLIIFALQRVDAGVIAPLQYLEIIGATFWGWLIFKALPDPLTWLGIAIIVASGLFVFYRESVTE